MTIKLGSGHKTQPGANIFLDLGFDEKIATKYKLESDERIAKKNAAKEKMMIQIADWMKAKNLKQEQAAKILMISRPRLSDVVQKKTVKFTIDSLYDMLDKTGKKVDLVISN